MQLYQEVVSFPIIFTKSSFFMLLILQSVHLQIDSEESEDYSLQKSCRTIHTCRDCKKSDLDCEWCHNFGCTKFPHLYCPKKILLSYLFNNENKGLNDCSKILSKGPIFIPANVRRVIKLEMAIDDVRLFKEKLLCVIQIDNKIIELNGFLDNRTVFCDSVALNSLRSVILGSIHLKWQSVEPYSNNVLVIVYNCHTLAQNCNQCQILNKRFSCGWCAHKSMCGLIEECPAGFAPWFDKNYKCDMTELHID